MTAHSTNNRKKTRGHRPRLQQSKRTPVGAVCDRAFSLLAQRYGHASAPSMAVYGPSDLLHHGLHLQSSPDSGSAPAVHNSFIEFQISGARGNQYETNLEREHSPPRRGGVAATPIRFREATLIGADGVVSSAKTRPCRSFIDASPYRARASRHPVCAASVAPRHLLMAQPPLPLRGGECCDRFGLILNAQRKKISGTRSGDLNVIAG